jgi:hypothetical protein
MMDELDEMDGVDRGGELMSLGRTGIVAALAACFLCAACGGEADDAGTDVLSSFAYGQCGQPVSLASGYDTAALDRLQCVVAATPADGDWSVALVNFWAGCTYEEQAPWAGTAIVDADGTLALEAEWQFEYPNGCGSCLYAFDYLLEPFDFEPPLALELTISSCSGPDCASPALAASIEANEDAPAIECRYLMGTQGYGNIDMADDGSLYHADTEDGTCADGLVPRAVETELEPSLVLCLPACDVDEDCPLPEIEACDAGACVIQSPLALTAV